VTSRFKEDHIQVTRSEGSYGEDGYAEDNTKTVLDADGDAQQETHALRSREAFLDKGALHFFADGSVTDVRTGDSATVTTGERTIETTVEEVIFDDDSLLLSIDD